MFPKGFLYIFKFRQATPAAAEKNVAMVRLASGVITPPPPA